VTLLHCLVWYWFLEDNGAEIVTCVDKMEVYVKHEKNFRMNTTSRNISQETSNNRLKFNFTATKQRGIVTIA